MQRGHPTKEAELAIDRNIAPYLGKSYTASFISMQTGYDIKTVRKRIDKFVETVIRCQEKDLMRRQEKERAEILASCDPLMFLTDYTINELRREVTSYTSSGRPLPDRLVNNINKTVRTRADLIQARGLFSLQPTFNEALEKMIEEKIKKEYEKSRSGS